MRKLLLILTLSMLMLIGCGETEEVPEVVEPDLTEHMESATIFGLTIPAIGPVCGFVQEDDRLEIHPYYNSVEHITVERILLSDRPYWETIESSVSDTAVIEDTDEYSMFTTVSGVTYGYYGLSDTWGIVVKSDDLPSSYVKAVMERICQQGT